MRTGKKTTAGVFMKVERIDELEYMTLTWLMTGARMHIPSSTHKCSEMIEKQWMQPCKEELYTLIYPTWSVQIHVQVRVQVKLH